MKKIILSISAFLTILAGGYGVNEVMGARTDDSGWVKKNISGVITDQLSDSIENVDLQGADLSNVGTMDITTVSSTSATVTNLAATNATITSSTIDNLTFTTKSQTMVDLGTDIGVSNVQIDASTFTAESTGHFSRAWKLITTNSSANYIMLMNDLPENNPMYSAMFIWTINGHSRTYQKTVYSGRMILNYRAEYSAGNQHVYRSPAFGGAYTPQGIINIKDAAAPAGPIPGVGATADGSNRLDFYVSGTTGETMDWEIYLDVYYKKW